MPSWRMNGLWRRMAGVLVLCALLLSNEVMCQDGGGTDAPTIDLTTVSPPASSTAASNPTTSDATTSLAASTNATQSPSITVTPKSKPDNQDGDNARNAAVPVVDHEVTVGVLADSSSKQEVKEATKSEIPSSDSFSASSGSSVFVGILVTGLLAALAITVGYFKCQRRSDPKGVKLAEEAYPVDQENQGNTLVSVAPLNPPPETQEKPSINGESTEPAKTESPPPNNGHSTTKTADTEL